MKLNKFLIANGNSTLLVKGYQSREKETIIRKYLGEVEQIGFISYPKGIPKLLMMGNELCINSTLALAGYLGKSGELFASGINGKVKYINSSNKTSITMNLEFIQKDKMVLFKGIGFICEVQGPKPNKKELAKLCKKYNLPAFGIILYRKNKSKPYVYVRDTDSLTAETACGSGSIALSIVTKIKDVIQPSGGIISITKTGNQFQVVARVKKIKLKGEALL